MWYEVVIGALVGAATYMYLHYLNKTKQREQLQQNVEQHAARNAEERVTEVEGMKWLNFIIKHWYLAVDEKLQKKIKEAVQPTLDALNLPSPITGVLLETITFGQSPPYIEGSKASRELWEDDPNLETLELELGPRIESTEFEAKVHLKGLGHVSLTGFKFKGQLKISILMDKSLPFPCIKHVYFTFTERPDLSFDLSLGVIDVNLLPNVKEWLTDTIEELVSDILVDPGRYLIDMSEPEMKMMLIFGVRKLKRTVLHLQVDINKNKTEQHSDKTRKIQCILNTGGKDFKSNVEFYRTQKTCHIWFPLAVLQEEKIVRRKKWKINLTVWITHTFAKDDKLAEMKIDIHNLVTDRTKELHRSVRHDENILLIVRATAHELPYIPIRQSGIEVTDYTPYFHIPEITAQDCKTCSSGLVYMHIHRATGLPAKDAGGSSDPYCKVKVNGEKLFKTPVVYANLNPNFNYFEDFFVRNLIESDVTLELMDYDRASGNDEIGKVRLNLKDVAPKMVNQGFDVMTKNGKHAGVLYITVIFRPVPIPPISADVTNTLHNNLGAVTVL